MIKLTLSRKYPYVLLTDPVLRRQVERLRKDNDELRARVVAAQHEKAVATKQAEALKSEKERLRLKVASQKQSSEAQRKAHEALQSKIQELREENETLKKRR